MSNIVEMSKYQDLSNEEIELMAKQRQVENQALLLELYSRQSLKIAKIDEKVDRVEMKLDQRMTLDYGQQRAVDNAVKKRVLTLWDDGVFNQEIHDTKRKAFSCCWKDIKDSFGVSSYRDIRQKDFEEALNFIKGWRPRII